MVSYHASCVELNGAGVLIFGESGSGKSDLALRLMDAGAVLVADDYVETVEENGSLHAFAPDNIKGLIEVRGIGIIQTDFKERTIIKLKVYLSSFDEIDRMPFSFASQAEAGGIADLKLSAFDVSAVAKIKTALAVVSGKNGLIS